MNIYRKNIGMTNANNGFGDPQLACAVLYYFLTYFGAAARGHQIRCWRWSCLCFFRYRFICFSIYS